MLPTLTDDDYARLLDLRTGLRVFLHWSEEQAADAGLTAAQHQLLLAVRGHPGPPTIGDIAESLLLKQPSATELVDRAERAGLVARSADQADRRVVHVSLTPRGRRKLEALSRLHLDELHRLAQRIGPIIAGLDQPVAANP